MDLVKQKQSHNHCQNKLFHSIIPCGFTRFRHDSFICKPHEDLYLFIDCRGPGWKQQLPKQQTVAPLNGKQIAKRKTLAGWSCWNWRGTVLSWSSQSGTNLHGPIQKNANSFVRLWSGKQVKVTLKKKKQRLTLSILSTLGNAGWTQEGSWKVRFMRVWKQNLNYYRKSSEIKKWLTVWNIWNIGGPETPLRSVTSIILFLEIILFNE